MTVDRAQQAADAIAALGDATPAQAKRTLNEFANDDLIAALATSGGGAPGGTQQVEVLRTTITPATPGLLTGVTIATLNEGDILVAADGDVWREASVITVWDGSSPVATAYLDNGVDSPYQATGNTVDLTDDDSATIAGSGADMFPPGASSPLYTTSPSVCRGGSIDIVVIIDDGLGGATGATTGEVEFFVFVIRAA